VYRLVKVILTAELYKYRKSSGPRDTALWAANFSSLLVNWRCKTLYQGGG